MRRGYKITLWILGGLTALGIFLVAAFSWSLSSGDTPEIEARELTSDELPTINHWKRDIHVKAGFIASEFGGWHGDGGRVKIYLIDPNRSEDLLEGIKNLHEKKFKENPDSYVYPYKWTVLSKPKLSSLDHLIPEKFHPPEDEYVIGRSKDRSHTISIGKKSGYVCYGHVRS